MKTTTTAPTYRPRGHSIQVGFRLNGRRYRKSFPTLEAAQQYHADTLAIRPNAKPERPSDGPRSSHGEPTLSWLLRHATDTHWNRLPSARTAIANATQCVNLLGPTRRVSSVDGDAVESLVSRLWRSGLSGSTINRKLASLIVMLRLAYDRGWVKRRPEVRPRMEWIQPFPYLREDAERKLIAWAEGTGLTSLRDLVALLIDTGISPAEALALHAADVGECITFGPKAETPERVITLSDRVRELVERRRSSAGPSGLLFGGYGREDADRDWSLARSALSLPPDPSLGLECLHDTFCMRTVCRLPGLPGAFAITQATGRQGPGVMKYDQLREQEADGRPYPPAVGKPRTPLGPQQPGEIQTTAEPDPAGQPGTPPDDADGLRVVAEAWPWLPRGVRAGFVEIVTALQRAS